MEQIKNKPFVSLHVFVDTDHSVDPKHIVHVVEPMPLLLHIHGHNQHEHLESHNNVVEHVLRAQLLVGNPVLDVENSLTTLPKLSKHIGQLSLVEVADGKCEDDGKQIRCSDETPSPSRGSSLKSWSLILCLLIKE